MIKYYTFLIFFFLGHVSSAQIIDFPDANFKSKLFDYGATKDANQTIIAIDADLDGEISVTEAQNVYYLNVSGVSTNLISSLQGIGYFTNLVELNCQDNLLQTLDLSEMAHLRTLRCRNNLLESLDLSNMPALDLVNAEINRIASLASINFTGSPLIDSLDLDGNLLTSVDASYLPASLVLFYFSFNQVTSVNLYGLPNLEYLSCYHNQLTSIDTGNLPALAVFSCSDNQLTSLDFSQNQYLSHLYCTNNQLTTLDLSNNHQMYFADLRYNNLTSLYMANVSEDIAGLHGTMSGNPNLAFICADAFEIGTIQNWIVSLNMTNCTVSTSCNLSRPDFDDNQFAFSPNPANDVLNIHSKMDVTIDAVEIYNLLGALVQTDVNPSETINVCNLKSGIYLLRITTSKGISNSKFIKK